MTKEIIKDVITRETIKDVQHKINVMQAFLDGKEIESRRILSFEWTYTLNPLWQWGIYDYRVKKNYRPFETIDEVFDAMKLHGGILCYEKTTKKSHWLSINTREVIINSYAVSFDEFLEKYIFEDETPCGVEITE